jgi:undecaprenyl-diphosphatase
MNIPALFAEMDGRDRALFMRVVLGARGRRSARYFWTIVTHLGGAHVTIVAALVPLFWSDFAAVGSNALLVLVLSHALVQMVKRSVDRRRPSTFGDVTSLVAEPDRFSFPSGHSAASMAVAFAYAVAFPHLALPLALIAFFVGASRVVLGVHYPGDVLTGQVLAVVTGVALMAFR